MAGLWICKSYSELNMTQTSSFCLNRTVNRVNMFKFITIDRVLSVSYTIHSTSSLYNPFPAESLKKYKIKTNPSMGILIYFKIQHVQPRITRNALKKSNFRWVYSELCHRSTTNWKIFALALSKWCFLFISSDTSHLIIFFSCFIFYTFLRSFLWWL